MAGYVEVNMDERPEMKSFRLHMPEGGIFSGWTGRLIVFFSAVAVAIKVVDMLK